MSSDCGNNGGGIDPDAEPVECPLCGEETNGVLPAHIRRHCDATQ